MKKLLIYLKEYKKESLLAPLFKMLEASFELFIPLVVATMIDVGIGAGEGSYIVKMSLLMVVLGIIGLVCAVTAQYFSAKAAVGFATKLRHVLFSHVQGLSFSEIDQVGTSALITRMTSDINQVQSGVNLVLRLFLRSPFIVFGAMVMAFTIDVKSAWIFAVTIPLLSIVVFGIMLISIPLYKKVQSRLDAILKITRENLTGVRVIRAFHREKEEEKLFQDGNHALTDMQNFVGRITAFMNPVTYMIINGALLVLLYTGAVRVDSGILTQGQVVALVNYMSQILVELIKLANLIITVTKAVACGNRIQSVLEIENSQKAAELCRINKSCQSESAEEKKHLSQSPKNMRDKNRLSENVEDIQDKKLLQKNVESIIKQMQHNVSKRFERKEKETPVVEFQNVSLTYKNAGDKSLSNISFQANDGETIGIIGGTGSGKTSLVHLIPRFYDATEGRVLIDGEDVCSYDIAELRQKVGIVLQKAVLFTGTLRENRLWGKEDAVEEELQEALRIAQAAEVVAGKENKLEEMVAQGGKNFSGGQRQRLTIARALVRKPEILILDDSSSALDYATDAKLRSAIWEMSEKPVVFIVSQRTASICHADKIIVLDEGEAVGIGTHTELLENCQVYREIYESQYQQTEMDESEKEEGKKIKKTGKPENLKDQKEKEDKKPLKDSENVKSRKTRWKDGENLQRQKTRWKDSENLRVQSEQRKIPTGGEEGDE